MENEHSGFVGLPFSLQNVELSLATDKVVLGREF